ncbi:hypothetical protein GCM10020295_16930 [Streptomyces cinereospinus]
MQGGRVGELAAFAGGRSALLVGVGQRLGRAQGVLGLLPAALGVEAALDQQGGALQRRRRGGRGQQGRRVDPAGPGAQAPDRGLEGIVVCGRSGTGHGGMRHVALPERAIELLSGGIPTPIRLPGQGGG